MNDTYCLDYRSTGYFSELICDYLDQKPILKKYYNRFPSIENFQAQINERSDFDSKKRQVLVSALKSQYGEILQNDPTAKVQESILSLGDSKTFTVVTGHQLNIFTGPLYFLYKIISTLNLAEALKAHYPAYRFVPVYWMASEDHDFAEINHINYAGGRLQWDREASGPVGRLGTEGLQAVIAELSEHLGPGTHARSLIKLFKESYSSESNLAQATRTLVHALFGDKGLVILDADEASLKKLAIPYFKKDLFEQRSFQMVKTTTESLKQNYSEQVHVREINLFYIKDNSRERIVKSGERWQVLNSSIDFDQEKLNQEMDQHPERFSPNVVLRPLYQEVVLPNLTYIGGGGELAYWLQLKDMFDDQKVPFPMLVLRNSVLWLDKKQQQKLAGLQISKDSLFQSVDNLKKEYVSERAPVDPELSPYEKQLQQMFDELEEVAHLTDKSMLGAVNAQRQKQLNGLENLKKKLIRAEKRRHSEDVERIERAYFGLFPKGSLQERHDNLAIYYAEYGPKWLEHLKERLSPLAFKFCVIEA